MHRHFTHLVPRHAEIATKAARDHSDFCGVTRSDRGPDEREGGHEVLVRDERAEVVGGVGVVKDVFVYNTRKLSRIQSNPSG